MKGVTITDVSRAHDADASLTFVELTWHKQRIENRIRFGRPAGQQILDRHRRVLSFTARQHLLLRAMGRQRLRHHPLARRHRARGLLPASATRHCRSCVPAATSSCAWTAGPRSSVCCRPIDAVEALGIDPADVAPDYWQHVHNRLSVNETPRNYTRTRHQAWLKRREVSS